MNAHDREELAALVSSLHTPLASESDARNEAFADAGDLLAATLGRLDPAFASHDADDPVAYVRTENGQDVTEPPAVVSVFVTIRGEDPSQGATFRHGRSLYYANDGMLEVLDDEGAPVAMFAPGAWTYAARTRADEV